VLHIFFFLNSKLIFTLGETEVISAANWYPLEKTMCDTGEE